MSAIWKTSKNVVHDLRSMSDNSQISKIFQNNVCPIILFGRPLLSLSAHLFLLYHPVVPPMNLPSLVVLYLLYHHLLGPHGLGPLPLPRSVSTPLPVSSPLPLPSLNCLSSLAGHM